MSEIDTASISSHFRELQQEKKKLENKLDHLLMKRKDLESKQDIVSKKNLLLNQKYGNMSRTSNVAKRKVQETQHHVDRLQKMNDVLQKDVGEVKKQISDEEKRAEEQVENYQLRLDELAENFRHGRKYYIDEVLVDEEKQWKISLEEKKSQIASDAEFVQNISEKLDKLKLVKDQVPEEKPPRSTWNQYLESCNSVTGLFNEENVIVRSTLERYSNSVNSCKNSLGEVQRQITELKENKSSP